MALQPLSLLIESRLPLPFSLFFVYPNQKIPSLQAARIIFHTLPFPHLKTDIQQFFSFISSFIDFFKSNFIGGNCNLQLTFFIEFARAEIYNFKKGLECAAGQDIQQLS